MKDTQLPSAPVWVSVASALIRRLPAGRYRLMHSLCRRPPAAFLKHMPAEFGGFAFRCDLRDAISREVCFAGQYEPQETALVRSILRPGMCFVDVGANWGYFTLLAADLVGGGGRVVSLEPDPRLFPVLRENVERGGLRQVTVMQVAAAGSPGLLTLDGYDEGGENFGVSRLAVGAGAAASRHAFQVRADALDAILGRQQPGAVDLMKMDIEGAEVFALAGLTESLREGRVKRLLLELHPVQIAEYGSSASRLIEGLEGAGYRAWTIDHSPEATRRAAYSKSFSADRLLRPLDSAGQLDAWPHQLWLAPGVE